MPVRTADHHCTTGCAVERPIGLSGKTDCVAVVDGHGDALCCCIGLCCSPELDLTGLGWTDLEWTGPEECPVCKRYQQQRQEGWIVAANVVVVVASIEPLSVWAATFFSVSCVASAQSRKRSAQKARNKVASQRRKIGAAWHCFGLCYRKMRAI